MELKLPALVKVAAFWDTLRTSYWFVPTVMAVAAAMLYAVVNQIDQRLGDKLVDSLGWVFTGSPEGARELLSVVAASMITIAGVTFSITIVALTLASQQFGPFLLRNFMKDAGNQVVLGTFISTFMFCLLTLRTIRGTDKTTFVPHLSVSVAILLGMCSLGVLIYFIHHVSAFIQAPNIIAVVSEDLQQAIDRIFPDRLGAAPPQGGSKAEDEIRRVRENQVPVKSREYGYLKAIDSNGLLKVATENQLIVRLLKKPGDFVGQGDTIAVVSPAGPVDDGAKETILASMILGEQRTVTQDVLFVVSQIVEVAVRSLSSGINDPFTTGICIDHLGQGLRKLTSRVMPAAERYAEKELRVVALPITFSEIVSEAFDQIRHYGRSSPAVLLRLLDTIGQVAQFVRTEEQRRVLRYHASLVMEEGAVGLANERARSKVNEAFNETIKILEEKKREIQVQ